jgi:hypothetical protein
MRRQPVNMASALASRVSAETTNCHHLTNLQGAQPEGFISDIVALYAPKPHSQSRVKSPSQIP